jgi:adenylate cyclase|tara:strand:- start:4663 stop:5643 length:981 start_codon:yes stop_codon:yes gene_type:complete
MASNVPAEQAARQGQAGAAQPQADTGQGAPDRVTLMRQADKKLQQAEMLLNVLCRVAAIESLDEVLKTLVEMIAYELGAERASLFLNDGATGELYSRVAQGNLSREIRMLNTIGIAGAVFQSGKGEIIADAYKDDRFNRKIDEQTGFKTRNIVCAPVKTVTGNIIGVTQALNKKEASFTTDDLNLLEAITTQAAALQSTQFVERMKKNREKEMEFLDVVSDVMSELELGTLLAKVMSEATRNFSAAKAAKPRCCFPTSAASPPSPNPSAPRARSPCSTIISPSWSTASPAKAACWTSSSATPSWPGSAFPSPTRTTRTGPCAPPSP